MTQEKTLILHGSESLITSAKKSLQNKPFCIKSASQLLQKCLTDASHSTSTLMQLHQITAKTQKLCENK
jgi:hypothetical protein